MCYTVSKCHKILISSLSGVTVLQQTVSVTSIFNFGHIVKSLEVKEGIILKKI